MAEKSTTKATPAAKKKVELSVQEQLVARRNDLHAAKMSLAAGELINPRVIGAYRKDVARLLTTINAQKEAK